MKRILVAIAVASCVLCGCRDRAPRVAQHPVTNDKEIDVLEGSRHLDSEDATSDLPKRNANDAQRGSVPESR